MPGNMSLDSMLTEIRGLNAIRAGVETARGLAVPGEQADRRVGERESEGVRLLAMDMSVGAHVPLQMAQPFQRRSVVRRQSLPLNQSSR
ncbi:hypothetical protein [Streptosporangium sp. NPDC001681]|uniref:hypothetical protein n=1 Tax=Streptosporangium sp. NPDC001681 TaxID=3154395 RepID=UPI00332F2E4C